MTMTILDGLTIADLLDFAADNCLDIAVKGETEEAVIDAVKALNAAAHGIVGGNLYQVWLAASAATAAVVSPAVVKSPFACGWN